MPMKTFDDAFINELQEVLHAEKQLSKALPKMAKKASHDELRQAFEQHKQETDQQIDRLERVFQSLQRTPRAKKCLAMEGLIDEGKDLMTEQIDPDILDAMLIATAQRAEHYEIASYGTLCTWAELLGHDEALELLRENLAEEKQTDQRLTRIAKQVVNQEAAAHV